MCINIIDESLWLKYILVILKINSEGLSSQLQAQNILSAFKMHTIMLLSQIKAQEFISLPIFTQCPG